MGYSFQLLAMPSSPRNVGTPILHKLDLHYLVVSVTLSLFILLEMLLSFTFLLFIEYYYFYINLFTFWHTEIYLWNLKICSQVSSTLIDVFPIFVHFHTEFLIFPISLLEHTHFEVLPCKKRMEAANLKEWHTRKGLVSWIYNFQNLWTKT